MEEKREKEANSKSSSTMANSVAFSDEIPNMTMTMSFPFSPAFSTIFDIMPPLPPPPSSSLPHDPKASNFPFMDLLAVPDYTPSLFDWPQNTAVTSPPPPPAPTQITHALPSPASSNVPDGSEVLNTPPSPNYSSISSSSNEAAAAAANKATGNEDEAEEDETATDAAGKGEDQDQDKSKNQ